MDTQVNCVTYSDDASPA